MTDTVTVMVVYVLHWNCSGVARGEHYVLLVSWKFVSSFGDCSVTMHKINGPQLEC